MAAEFQTSGFSDALVILGAAGLVIPTFARFRISPVIGFILVGLLVGPAGLGAMTGEFPWLNYITISNPHAIEPFAEFGIILLLFAIGLELSFRRLWVDAAPRLRSRRRPAPAGCCDHRAALHLMGQSWGGSIGLGLALALSSTALSCSRSSAPPAPSAAPHLRCCCSRIWRSCRLSSFWERLPPTRKRRGLGGLVNTLLLGALTVAIMLVLGRFLLPKLFAQAARTKSPELFLAASLLVVIVASLATTAVGLSPLMGALLAGILIAETTITARSR
jgi:CPA2 family monovalent cation:H+ antiporter-2